MIEQIRAIPFIAESEAVKLLPDRRVERYTRILQASEFLPSQLTLSCDRPVYVEAKKFFALLAATSTVSAEPTCLTVGLQNGAVYRLPFMDVQWDDMRPRPSGAPRSVETDIMGLSTCILGNNMRPELQCIYMDAQGAVTCDSINACINPNVRFDEPILMLPDIQPMLWGRKFAVLSDANLLHIEGDGFTVQIMSPEEKGDDWAMLRELAATPTEPVFKGAIEESLRRLANFGECVRFKEGKLVVGANEEPGLANMDSGNVEFKIASLTKLLPYATKLALAGTNIHLYDAAGMQFIVSGEETE
jgi:hypothetical protein